MTFLEFWFFTGALVTWASIETLTLSDEEQRVLSRMTPTFGFLLFLVVANIAIWPAGLVKMFRDARK